MAKKRGNLTVFLNAFKKDEEEKRIMTSHSGLMVKLAGFRSTYLDRFVNQTPNNPRCVKRKKGYASRCDKPAKVGYQSVYDMSVVFWCCGIHKQILMKYVIRGSFYLLTQGREIKAT